MGEAKEIVLRPITSKEANALVQRVHYSGKVVKNSQLHVGVFFRGRLEGAMQFGPSLDKRKVMSLVEGTGWDQYAELNRMAFGDALPRNSESRALSIAMRMLRKHAPALKWVVSFADATQCGDGTIYRASGFVLTSIRKNTTLWEFPDGERVSNIGIKTGYAFQRRKFGRELLGEAAMQEARKCGARRIPGYQLRYVYFLDPAWRARLSVPEVPFSEIERLGAGMYRGAPVARAAEVEP